MAGHPHGGLASGPVALFKRTPAAKPRWEPPPYPVFEHFCWNDRDADGFAASVRAEGLPVADVVPSVLAAVRGLRDEPDRAVLRFGIGAQVLSKRPPEEVTGHLDAGPPAAEDPLDPLDRADALALLAQTTAYAAWDVRGGGRYVDVGEEVWPVFHRMLEDADELGRRALDLVPDHPGAATTRILTGRGLGVSQAERRHRFDVARRRRPTLYAAHLQMLQSVCRKWSGSHDLMFDYAHRVAADAPAGDPVSAVLPMAHVELWLDAQGAEGEARAAQVRRDDLAAVRAASDRWLSTPSAHPFEPAAHQVFGWFFVLTGDLPRANVHLSRTGGRIADFPWGYYDDPVRMYRACLSDAKVPPPG